MNSGYFTIAIQHISNHKNDLIAISGLSIEAAAIHKQAIGLLTDNILYMSSLQETLQAHTRSMLTKLQSAVKFMNQNNREACIEEVYKSNEIALLFDEELNDAIAYTLEIKSGVIKFSHKIDELLSQLEKQHQQLLVDEQKAKDKVDKYKKERYYFLALGPFGLAGLATATGLFTSWTTKANNASKKVKNKRNEINQIKKFKSDIFELQESYRFSIEVLTNVKNVLVFLTGDINNVINNIENSNEEATILALYLNASIKQLEIMQLEIA